MEPLAREILFRRLVTEGPRADSVLDFVVGFARWLEDAGISLLRVVLFIGTLHPQVKALGCIWHRGETPEEKRLPVGEIPDLWLNSSLRGIFEGEMDALRVDVAGETSTHYSMLDELRRKGATDYFALLLPFSDGRRNAVGYVTDAQGGFTADQIGLLRELVEPLSLVSELLEQRRLTATLVDTYLGHGPGQAVLAGAIHRGDHHHIDAVLLIVDLRGSTHLGDTLDEADLLRTFDDYFRVVVEGIESFGGDVLKFMGDGLLAIFPIADVDVLSATCQAAMRAVQRIEAGIQAENDGRRLRSEPVLDFVAALHVGRVLYGNIGSTDRLDFTIVGPAVNLAARFETLGKALEVRVIATKSFAAACGLPMRSLGRHPVHGLADPVEAFAPRPPIALAAAE